MPTGWPTASSRPPSTTSSSPRGCCREAVGAGMSSQMGTGRLRRGALQVGLAVIALGISLVIFEGMVRLFVPVSDFFWQPDPVLGSRLVPNKTGRFVRRGQFDVPVTINSHGFRDREH